MKVNGRDIGICSWSLADGDTTTLIRHLKTLGLNHVQLDLNPFLDGADASTCARVLRAAGIVLTAGMMGFSGEDYKTIQSITATAGFVPDDVADERIERALAAAELGRSVFGVDRISTHAGALAMAGAANYQRVQGRMKRIATRYAELGLELLLETGQESPSVLISFLSDLASPNVKVNFDPANMILYGAGDYLQAFQQLGSCIGHVHIKDAIASDRPGQTWGKEVAPGLGQVNWKRFLQALDDIGYRGPLVIEREAGADRLADIERTLKMLVQT